MTNKTAPLSAGVLAIVLAANSVVFAQNTTPNSVAAHAQSSTRSETDSVSTTPNTNDSDGATNALMPNVVDSRTTSSPVVSSRGVVALGLADARNLSDADAPVLSLVDALALAIQNNPTIQIAQASLRAARARVGNARSQGGAQVGLSGDINGSRNFGATSNTSGGGTGGGGTGGGGTGTVGNNFLGFNTNESVGVSATLPIYNGGRIKAGTRAAQANVDVQAFNALQTEQDLMRDTTTSYLNILRSDQLLTVADSNLAISREQLRIAQVRFDAGAAARLEVFQAQATLADADQRRTQASAILGQSKATLNTLVGRVPETPIRVEPISSLDLRLASFAPNVNAANENPSISSTRLAPTKAQTSTVTNANATDINATTLNATNSDATLSGADLRARAAASRPALAASQAQIQSANAAVDLARAQRKPSLGLNLGALLRNPVSFVGRFALSLGLGFSQSLFDSGRSRSQIDEAQALLEQSRAGLSNAQLNVGNQIEQSLLSLDSAQARTVSAQAAVVAAQEALRAAQIGYTAGVRTSLDVSTAQAQLLTAQTNAVNARFDVATGQAQLASAVGVLTVQQQEAAARVAQSQIANRAQVEANAPKPKKKRRKFLGIF